MPHLFGEPDQHCWAWQLARKLLSFSFLEGFFCSCFYIFHCFNLQFPFFAFRTPSYWLQMSWRTSWLITLECGEIFIQSILYSHRVAELGSLSSGAKMPMEIFVKHVFTIFASNASFLRIITNLQNYLSEICNIYHVIVHFLLKKHCCWPKKALFLPKDLQKVSKSRQILICDKIAYIQA